MSDDQRQGLLKRVAEIEDQINDAPNGNHPAVMEIIIRLRRDQIKLLEQLNGSSVEQE